VATSRASTHVFTGERILAMAASGTIPHGIAPVVPFPASRDARYVTEQTFPVAGGHSIA
jgi:NAD(P)-dependent dehydrogenase (short-subunit alcohol dehydrogenase family)